MIKSQLLLLQYPSRNPHSCQNSGDQKIRPNTPLMRLSTNPIEPMKMAKKLITRLRFLAKAIPPTITLARHIGIPTMGMNQANRLQNAKVKAATTIPRLLSKGMLKVYGITLKKSIRGRF